MDISRRDALKAGVGAGAAFFMGHLRTPTQAPSLLNRTIPVSGEAIPAVGLGTARRFAVGESAAQRAPLEEVLRRFHQLGGTVLDTAPTYGTAEGVAGDLARKLGIQAELFLATKISRARTADDGRRQAERSMQLWGRDTIDLNQVHNLGNVETHLKTLRQSKEAGQTRYVGITTSRYEQFEEMESLLRREALDFVQLNYSLGERRAADRLLPLAHDRGVAVVVNEPYNGGGLFRRVRGKELPSWAAELDCATWGQFFLKYILGHPAVTVVVPATANPDHVVDNMGAGLGRVPDPEARRRMEEWFDALPS